MTSEPDAPMEGPEFEMWNHLWGAIDQARDELRVLAPDARKLVEETGELITRGRLDFVLVADERAVRVADLANKLLTIGWFRHAAEIELASAGVSRVVHALERLAQLRPVVAQREVPERARSYLREAVDAYVFGFDASCIAFCRGTCEQFLKDALIATGKFSEKRIQREQWTAGTLVQNAKREGLLLREALDAAEALVHRGDHVLHRAIFEEKVLPQLARDSVKDLARLAAALLTT